MRASVLLTALMCGCAAQPPSTIVVEANSAAISGDRLVEAIGIESLGEVFAPLLDAGCTLPCETTQIFSPAEVNQAALSFILFRGRAERTAENTRLGRYSVSWPAPPSRARVRIAVTLRAAGADIVLAARGLGGLNVTLERSPD